MRLAGHDKAWREWRTALAGPRMHHGWILGGRRGVGKAAFAVQAARELVAEPGTPQPPGAHPDIIVLEALPASTEDEKKREEGKPYQRKRSISVEQVRGMQQRLTTRPTLGSRRAIVVDPADELEKSASNALLKSLEEPPQGSFFLLVAHRPGRLLPTIRSRCRLLSFSGLDDAEVDAAIEREAPQASPEMREAAVAVAGGSPGVALDFIELDVGAIHRLMKDIVANGDPEFVRRGALAEAMGPRPDRKRQFAAIDLARSVVAARMAATPRRDLAALADTHAELVRLAAQAPIYNFDPGILIAEIGTLLASLAARSEPAHG